MPYLLSFYLFGAIAVTLSTLNPAALLLFVPVWAFWGYDVYAQKEKHEAQIRQWKEKRRRKQLNESRTKT